MHGAEQPLAIPIDEMKKYTRIRSKSIKVSSPETSKTIKRVNNYQSQNASFILMNIQGDNQSDLDTCSQTEDYSTSSTAPTEGIRGIRNQGASCYMSVGVQCLVTLDTIKNYFISGEYRLSNSRTSKILCEAFSNAALELYGSSSNAAVPR